MAKKLGKIQQQQQARYDYLIQFSIDVKQAKRVLQDYIEWVQDLEKQIDKSPSQYNRKYDKITKRLKKLKITKKAQLGKMTEIDQLFIRFNDYMKDDYVKKIQKLKSNIVTGPSSPLFKVANNTVEQIVKNIEYRIDESFPKGANRLKKALRDSDFTKVTSNQVEIMMKIGSRSILDKHTSIEVTKEGNAYQPPTTYDKFNSWWRWHEYTGVSEKTNFWTRESMSYVYHPYAIVDGKQVLFHPPYTSLVPGFDPLGVRPGTIPIFTKFDGALHPDDLTVRENMAAEIQLAFSKKIR